MTDDERTRARAADRYLRRYADAERDIISKKRQLVRLERIARNLPVPSLDATPVITGHVSDTVGDAAAALADAGDELNRRIVEAMRVRRQVQAVIDRQPDARDRAMLERRYIEGMSYPRIADDLGYYGANNVHRHIWRILARIKIA